MSITLSFHFCFRQKIHFKFGQIKKIRHSIYLFLCALILQIAIVDDVTANMSNEEFTKQTDSKVEDAFCVGSHADKNSLGWSEKITNIQLKMNVENYLSNTLKKVKNDIKNIENEVSTNKSKYQKIKIKLNGTDCWMSGKYRLTGDLGDHFGIHNEIIHSIKVKLNNGKINNILKFKLFTPTSRRGKLEVLNTVIHQKLGLLAPRTALINVQIGGQSYKAIFQEDISEQLLEHNDLHASILLEGHEGYLPFNTPKIINRSFVANEQFKDISIYALEKLGRGYQYTAIINNEKKIDSPIFLNFLPVSSQKEFIYFHLLNFSLNSAYGLTLDDSRFVYDHISRRYHPIYYDGHAGEISKVSDINFGIPDDIQSRLLKDLMSLNLIKLETELNTLGAQFSIEELHQIKSEAINFIKSTQGKKTSHDPEKKLFKTNFIQQAALEIMHKNNLSSLQVSWMLNATKFKKCIYSANKKSCVQESLNNQKLIPQLETQSLNSGIFLHGLSEEPLDAPYFQELAINTLTLLGTGTTIEHTSNLELSVDVSSKTVIVSSKYKNALTSQIKVSNGILDGWEFIIEKGVFLGYEKHPDTRASKFGLTGCITFNDVIIRSLNVQMQETMCEDSIHFVRTKGDIESITISKAFSDAIDADFSDLVFSNLIISDAGNDCVDFSAGTYQIIKSEFNNCGDKGLSAGEDSKVVLGNSEIRGALIGIVAKDGSTVAVREANLFDVGVCLAAYKKKQEYGVARLDVKKIRCSSDKYFMQNGSHLSYQLTSG